MAVPDIRTLRPTDDAFEFDATTDVASNRRDKSLEPDPDECPACRHVHKDPGDMSRKCWAWVTRRVGKLQVLTRIGHCPCRGDGAEAFEPKKPPICAACGKEFERTRESPKFCGPCAPAAREECFKRANEKRAEARRLATLARTKPCRFCGTAILPRLMPTKGDAVAPKLAGIYCGETCRKTQFNLKQNAKAAGFTLLALAVRFHRCETCGLVFHRREDRAFRWCSNVCCGKAMGGRTRREREASERE